MALQKPDDRIDQICEENREGEDDEHAARDIDDREHNSEEQNRAEHVDWAASRECHVFSETERQPQGYCVCVWLSSFCLIDASARSREERVLSTATLRTMPPLNPVRPACCEPLIVIR